MPVVAANNATGTASRRTSRVSSPAPRKATTDAGASENGNENENRGVNVQPPLEEEPAAKAAPAPADLGVGVDNDDSAAAVRGGKARRFLARVRGGVADWCTRRAVATLVGTLSVALGGALSGSPLAVLAVTGIIASLLLLAVAVRRGTFSGFRVNSFGLRTGVTQLWTRAAEAITSVAARFPALNLREKFEMSTKRQKMLFASVAVVTLVAAVVLRFAMRIESTADFVAVATSSSASPVPGEELAAQGPSATSWYILPAAVAICGAAATIAAAKRFRRSGECA
eukprot:TRINITY_DN22628_c0_g4_i1.p1 TRINITY_DN22628_c0_g4~~TRINITY_DN22628_c0_g4_i1.p1  ORF type:complete len:324 (-),score=73.16 TRINITY_DN22628_c0_g4_i1:269-1120(-)